MGAQVKGIRGDTVKPSGRVGWKLGLRLAGLAMAAMIFSGCASIGGMGPGDGPKGPAQPSLLEPPPIAAQEDREPAIPSGSLWSRRDDSPFQDIKARKVGDIVTIMVSEQSKASKSASTDTGRKRELTAEGEFLGLSTPTKTILRPLNPFDFDFKVDNTFEGDGRTSKSDTMSAYMTATVVQILPNGNMVIRGSRWTKVNDELQEIILEGIIRPMDISRDNTILSQNIAEAKIFFVGKGPVTRHQKPGLLGRLIDLLLPY
ncbi:flagellar basal body L-ring protein FlgH [Desulfoglaeba alkanexedens]|uniref:Flagellar L-ring protein n=1 Tax=Desulfoglaeba alkanexedens ALDC TaxID=980445 RepID=A0A4P8L7T9_9BACT|nr:flagellar basal body L-ring protein FlgH [Desulfoglaeba alkanexedens]QCQ22692.1 flagellar biosynthesis protein FlgH [Desulfoglaeba alkanexedens ALDC]